MAHDFSVTLDALQIRLGFNKKLQLIHSNAPVIHKLLDSLNHFGCPILSPPGTQGQLEAKSEIGAILRLEPEIYTHFYTLFNLPKPAHLPHPQSDHIERLIFDNEEAYEDYAFTLKNAGITIIDQGSCQSGNAQSKNFYIDLTKEHFKHYFILDPSEISVLGQLVVHKIAPPGTPYIFFDTGTDNSESSDNVSSESQDQAPVNVAPHAVTFTQPQPSPMPYSTPTGELKPPPVSSLPNMGESAIVDESSEESKQQGSPRPT